MLDVCLKLTNLKACSYFVFMFSFVGGWVGNFKKLLIPDYLSALKNNQIFCFGFPPKYVVDYCTL